jgi:hypothetical protein
MNFQLYKTFWGFDGSLADAFAQVREAGFDGIEAPIPSEPAQRDDFARQVADSGLGLIAEICTAGSYVPERSATIADHLADLEAKIIHGKTLNPRFFNVMAGCDAWSYSEQVDFFARAVDLADRHGVTCSFETHRGRSFFNPWVTRDVVRAVPSLKLTCDFSHWVVVAERLMDSEWDIIAELAPHGHHIHGRIGYPQGPQVPHPADPAYADCLRSHQRCWEAIWDAQRAQGYVISTLTPECGPDGYTHQIPFSGVQVADIWQMNRWMGDTEKAHFAHYHSALKASVSPSPLLSPALSS